MPAYVLSRNLKNNRAEACEFLQMLFAHADPMGLDLTDLVITKTGGGAGTVTITITQTLTAEHKAHLGLQ